MRLCWHTGLHTRVLANTHSDALRLRVLSIVPLLLPLPPLLFCRPRTRLLVLLCLTALCAYE
jgi:hypothetical protein